MNCKGLGAINLVAIIGEWFVTAVVTEVIDLATMWSAININAVPKI
jgi:hypothetical protein